MSNLSHSSESMPPPQPLDFVYLVDIVDDALNKSFEQFSGENHFRFAEIVNGALPKFIPDDYRFLTTSWLNSQTEVIQAILTTEPPHHVIAALLVDLLRFYKFKNPLSFPGKTQQKADPEPIPKGPRMLIEPLGEIKPEMSNQRRPPSRPVRRLANEPSTTSSTPSFSPSKRISAAPISASSTSSTTSSSLSTSAPTPTPPPAPAPKPAAPMDIRQSIAASLANRFAQKPPGAMGPGMLKPALPHHPPPPSLIPAAAAAAASHPNEADEKPAEPEKAPSPVALAVEPNQQVPPESAAEPPSEKPPASTSPVPPQPAPAGEMAEHPPAGTSPTPAASIETAPVSEAVATEQAEPMGEGRETVDALQPQPPAAEYPPPAEALNDPPAEAAEDSPASETAPPSSEGEGAPPTEVPPSPTEETHAPPEGEEAPSPQTSVVMSTSPVEPATSPAEDAPPPSPSGVAAAAAAVAAQLSRAGGPMGGMGALLMGGRPPALRPKPKEEAVAGPVTAKKDPRFVKYFQKLESGLPKKMVLKLMENDGVDKAILETPDEVIP